MMGAPIWALTMRSLRKNFKDMKRAKHTLKRTGEVFGVLRELGVAGTLLLGCCVTAAVLEAAMERVGHAFQHGRRRREADHFTPGRADLGV